MKRTGAFFDTRKFRTQLTLTISVIVLATIAIISVLSNILINKGFEKYAKEAQQSRAADIAANLGSQYNAVSGGWDLAYVHGVGMSALYDGYIIRLSDSGGAVVWDAENHDMETCSQVMMDVVGRMEQKRPGLNGKFTSREYGLQQDDRKIGSVIVSYYSPYFLSESEFHFLDSLNLMMAVIGALAVLCSLVAGGLLSKRVSRPIIKTARIATQIAEGNYKIRFDGQIKTRELDELVTAVNHMAASLDSQENLRARLTDDVAHELRTPLAAVSSHIETMIEGVWAPTPERLQSCYEELERISGLVSDLERLAKVENDNLRLTKTDVDLLSLARTVAGNFESESAKKSIAIDVSGEETFVNGDKDRLHQALANLLSNAIKYTPENGEIHVTARNADGSGVVTVEDDGAGISPEDLPFIFERFYRADKSRTRSTGGSGLGLAIARSIVNAHGGAVFAQSKDGKGSCFTITIPKSRAASKTN